jgi:type II secretion system protein J
MKEGVIIRSPQFVIRNGDGFTLIEVLLAVSIMAFIVSAIYMSFFTSSRNVQQAEAIRDSTDLARTLIMKIADDIHSAYCGSLTTGKTVFFGKKEEHEINGKTQRMDSIYLTPLTNWRTPNSKESELWEIGYYFKEKPNGSGYTLMRHEKRLLSSDVLPLEGGIDYEITDKAVEFRLRYLNGSSWAEEWGSSEKCTYPQAVEITLALEDGSTYTSRFDVGNTTKLR